MSALKESHSLGVYVLMYSSRSVINYKFLKGGDHAISMYTSLISPPRPSNLMLLSSNMFVRLT